MPMHTLFSSLLVIASRYAFLKSSSVVYLSKDINFLQTNTFSQDLTPGAYLALNSLAFPANDNSGNITLRRLEINWYGLQVGTEYLYQVTKIQIGYIFEK